MTLIASNIKASDPIKYEKSMECLKNHVKDDFVTWRHCVFIWNFSIFSLKLTCVFLEISDFQRFKNLWKAPFSHYQNQVRKIEHFKVFERKKVGFFREKIMWLILKRENNRKRICSIFGHFKDWCKCRQMMDTLLFNMFFGDFLVPPLNEI